MPNDVKRKGRTIVSSEIVEDSVQIDGRRYIREKHTDDKGQEHSRDFLAASDYDESAMGAYVVKLESRLAEKETKKQARETTEAGIRKLYNHIKDATLPLTTEERSLVFESLFKIP